MEWEVYIRELVECFFVSFKAVDEAQQKGFDCHFGNFSFSWLLRSKFDREIEIWSVRLLFAVQDEDQYILIQKRA